MSYSSVKEIYYERGRTLRIEDNITISDLSGIYKDIAEVIGIEATILLHSNFKGQQITLPQKLYTRSYIISQVSNNPTVENLKRVANQYGYTESRLSQLIKENNAKNIT